MNVAVPIREGLPHIVPREEIQEFSPRLIELDTARVDRWIGQGCPRWEWGYIRGYMRYLLSYFLLYYDLTPYQRALFGLLLLESESVRANFDSLFMQIAWTQAKPIGEETSSPVFLCERH